MHIKKQHIFSCIRMFLIALLFISCGSTKKANQEEYKATYYTKLENNDSASLEILNQIHFLEKQLKRKEQGLPYSTHTAQNLVTLSGISSTVIAIGYFGNQYKITQEVLNEWKKWYEENSKYISYRIIDNAKYINYQTPNGEKTERILVNYLN